MANIVITHDFETMVRASIQLRDFLKKKSSPTLPQFPYLIVIDMWGRTKKSDNLSIFGH